MPSLTDSVLEVGYGLLDKVCQICRTDWIVSNILQGLVPDFIIRPTIRALCRQRLREIDAGSFEANYKAKMDWIEGVRARFKIADLTEKANEQHYEVRLPLKARYSSVPNASASGVYGVHALVLGSLRQVLLLPLPHRQGDA